MYPHCNNCRKLFFVLRKMLPNINTNVLLVEWSHAVVNCISDSNTLYDVVFEGPAVENAFQVFLMNCSLVPMMNICAAVLTRICHLL